MPQCIGHHTPFTHCVHSLPCLYRRSVLQVTECVDDALLSTYTELMEEAQPAPQPQGSQQGVASTQQSHYGEVPSLLIGKANWGGAGCVGGC